jgi:Uma2 family endonuclease
MNVAESFDRPTFTVERYFEIDQESGRRHEFYEGEIFCMAGGSLNHNRIKDDCGAALNALFGKDECESFTSDQRMETLRNEKYCYPDVILVCGRIEMSERWQDTIMNPFAVVEVLSRSTEKFDRGKKLSSYKGVAGLRHVILVSQKEVLVEHNKLYGRIWRTTTYTSLDDCIVIEGKQMPLSVLYRRVEFKSEQAKS